MAKKRMFNLSIVDSDAFLDMPLSTQALYFHLNMRADDDGFIGNPKRIQRLLGASDDDLKLLLAKRFILVFEDGVIVIKHWRMHNTIRLDRYTPTVYQEELEKLGIKQNKSYTTEVNQMATKWQPNGNPDIDIDKGIDIDKDIVIDNNSESVDLILNDNTYYSVSEELINEYKKAYPDKDVKQELLKMKAWLISNPSKRKTKRGILRFINNWLNNTQKQTTNTVQKERVLPTYNTNTNIDVDRNKLIEELTNSLNE